MDHQILDEMNSSIAEEKDPEVGMKFTHCNEVKKFMDTWMDSTFQLLTRGRTVKLNGNDENFEAVQYRTIEYTCKHGGTPYRPQTSGQRDTRTCKTNCPVKIKFQNLKNQGYLEITEVELKHNHVHSKALYSHYPEVRRLQPEARDEATKSLKLGCNKKLLQADIKTRQNKNVTLKDLTNWKAESKQNSDKELIEAVNFLIDEKDADVSILKSGDKFRALYFTTPDMKQSLAAWSEIVAIDGTYSLLDSDLTVMLMLVEDSNGASEIVAVGLLAAEDAPTVDWFLKTFKNNNPEACSNINCFMSDKDHVGRPSLKKTFYNLETQKSPPIYICLFHTLKALRLAMGSGNLNLSAEEKKTVATFFQKLTYSSCEDEYNEIYKEFINTVSQHVQDYFNKNWHPIREEWTVFNMNEGNLSNRTNNRVESLNQKLKQVIPKRSTLMVFLKLFFTFLESHTSEVDSKAARMYSKNTVNVKKGSEEERILNFLTDEGALYVLGQMKRHEGIIIMDSHGKECSIKSRNRILKVTVDSCSCGGPSSSLLPCRHIFAVRKFHGLPLFHEQLCHSRWTRSYYQQTQRIFREKNSERIGVRLPLVCELKSIDVSEVNGRETLMKPLLDSLILIVSNSCRSTFDSRLNTLRVIEEAWKKDLQFKITNSKDSESQYSSANVNLSDLMANLKITSYPKSKPNLSVPQKRKLVRPIYDHLTVLATTSSSSSSSSSEHFQKNMKAIEDLQGIWSQQLEPFIEVQEWEAFSEPVTTSITPKTSFLPNNKIDPLESDHGNRSTVADINSPASIIVREKPRLSFITTPGKSRKKKLPISFIEKNESQQIGEMLTWLLPKDVFKNVIDLEQRIQLNSLNYHKTPLRDSFLDDRINIELISKYFTRSAFAAFKRAIAEKKQELMKKCNKCEGINESSPQEWLSCSCCLLSYHSQCINIDGRRTGGNVWFCALCVQRGGKK